MGFLSAFSLYLLLAFLCGVALVTQPGFNSTLAGNIGGPLNAAAISLTVSAVVVLALRYFFAPAFSFSNAFEHTPYWGWLGGFLGVFFVATSMYVAPRIGATSLISLFLCGQIVAALIYDKFGLFGYGEAPITLLRLAGVGLIIAGTGLVVAKQ